MNHHLFIYGSLIAGALEKRAQRILKKHCETLGPATVQGKLYDLGLYPGAIASFRKADKVYGEQLNRNRRPEPGQPKT